MFHKKIQSLSIKFNLFFLVENDVETLTLYSVYPDSAEEHLSHLWIERLILV